MKKQLRLLKAMADETRLKMLKALSAGEKSATEIVPYTGKAQPTVSLNLRLLEHLEIIESEKRGRFIFYRLKEQKINRIMELLNLK